jgi:hypothetical protein
VSTYGYHIGSIAVDIGVSYVVRPLMKRIGVRPTAGTPEILPIRSIYGVPY